MYPNNKNLVFWKENRITGGEAKLDSRYSNSGVFIGCKGMIIAIR
jgi:hypothetical protein